MKKHCIMMDDGDGGNEWERREMSAGEMGRSRCERERYG